MIGKLLAANLALLAPAAASAKWHEASSAHFIVYADEDPEKLKAFSAKLERFDKVMRHRLRLDDRPLGPANRLTVFVVPSIASVQRLAGRGQSDVAGFYIPRASGSVAFVPRRTGSSGLNDINADTVFFHEYAHHFLLGNFVGALPPWYVEGFAEFYSTARFEKDGSVGIGAPANHRARELFLARPLPLEKMLDGRYSGLSAEEIASLYGRGWLLTHMLFFEPERRGQLARYVTLINEGKTGLEAARTAFGDLKQLDKEMRSYLMRSKLSYIQTAASALPIGPVDVRPLSAGEAAFMPVRMRSTRGVNDKTAAALVPDARRAAAPFARDAAVQASLAEVEHDAGNLAEADAAADRALAVDPANTHALIYKGRIAFKRAAAAKATDAKTWRDVRGWFTRAARIDPEDPEPKMLFHATFGAEGRPATANAVTALVEAMSLAPQDSGLRLQVARQHLIDGKAEAAAEAMGPVAFNPHGGPLRDWAAGVMAKIRAGDTKAALAAWDAAGAGSRTAS